MPDSKASSPCRMLPGNTTPVLRYGAVATPGDSFMAPDGCCLVALGAVSLHVWCNFFMGQCACVVRSQLVLKCQVRMATPYMYYPLATVSETTRRYPRQHE